jgi:hypothetical protein
MIIYAPPAVVQRIQDEAVARNRSHASSRLLEELLARISHLHKVARRKRPAKRLHAGGSLEFGTPPVRPAEEKAAPSIGAALPEWKGHKPFGVGGPDLSALEFTQGMTPPVRVGGANEPTADPRPSEPPSEPRYVNVCLVDKVGGRALPGSSSPLTERWYDLRIHVAGHDTESVVQNYRDHAFPDARLPPRPGGHWLDAVAVSNDFQVQPDRHPFFLPHVGPSWVCGCNGQRHTCRPEDRRPAVLIPLRAPLEAGPAHVRIMVYFRNNLVQSQAMTADVAAHAGEGDGYTSWVDYSLTADLTDVGRLPARGLNILTNANADASHRIVFNDGDDKLLAFNLTEGQMRGAVDQARFALRDIHIVEGGGFFGKTMRNRYDDQNGKPFAAFVDDLTALARVGWKLWATLLTNHPERRDELRNGRLAEPTTIQIARTRGSGFIFPWALVYDIPFDEAAPSRCRLLDTWDAWRAEAEPGRGCPYAADHRMNTLCPFGFWGFKHTIEQPPPMAGGKGLPLAIEAGNKPLELLAGVSLELDDALLKAHFQRVQSRLSQFAVRVCKSRKDITEGLARPAQELVYFYCHGRREKVPGSDALSPYLSVGDGEKIRPEHIIAWEQGAWPKSHWRQTPPLVFINGCHTTDITPEALLNFVDAFASVNAAGVIGTEISVHQQVAGEVAEEFLFHFQSERSAGEAMRRVRTHLLRKGNLLGLAYTPFCSSDLRLTIQS